MQVGLADAEGLERPAGQALLPGQRQQHVLGADVGVLFALRFLLGERQYRLRVLAEPLERVHLALPPVTIRPS